MWLKIVLTTSWTKLLTRLGVCCLLRISGLKNTSTIFNPLKTEKEGAVVQAKAKANQHDCGARKAPGAVKLTSEGTPRRKGRCRNFGIYGHWAEDCKRPKKQRKEEKHDEANVVVGGADHNPALLLAVVVHLSENKLVVLVTYREKVWVPDTGASNHMTGCRAALTHLNERNKGAVKFGDGSSVEIHGLGSMVIQGQ